MIDLAAAVAAIRAMGVPYPMDLDEDCVPPPGTARASQYLRMRDGVRLAVDLHLPPYTPGSRLPTCIRSTRYWRATVDEPLGAHLGCLEAARWTAAGFALVLVDVRGTGASYGTWIGGWSDTEADDLREVVDWIVAQDWSDGTVGGYGTSYDGTAAHLLAATGHPAVKAVVPRFALFDGYHHIVAPGGVPQDQFAETWSAMNWALDGHPDRGTLALPAPPGGVRPVDDDVNRQQRAAAQHEHRDNWDLWPVLRSAEDRGTEGPDIVVGTPLARLADLRAAGVPMWLWSGWYDGAYAAAALAQLADADLDVRVTIGPFAHGAQYRPFGDPLQPDLTNIPMGEQIHSVVSYLRRHQVGDVPDPAPVRLRYWRLGDGWQESRSWPPPNVRTQRLFLAASGHLTPAHVEGERAYAVDFSASSGVSGTRWHTLLGGSPVDYGDRADADAKLVVWDGEVLAEQTAVTGTAVVHMELVADVADCAVHVYLEAVRADGSVLYLTEGQLRASHRKPGSGRRPYETYGPWHTHRPSDIEPLTPGEVAHLDIALWPISVLLPAGSRVRLALAGADTPLFRRIPSAGEVNLRVLASSWLDLPVETT